MQINLVPDMSMAAAPLTQVLLNAFNLASQTDADSLISYSAPARVEPMVLVDAELALFEDLPKLLSATNNLFSCYYIAAASRSLNVNSYRILRTIDHLSPSRSTVAALGDFANDSARRLPDGSGGVASRVETKIIDMVGESLSLPRYGSTKMALESHRGANKEGKFLARVATPQEKKEFDRLAIEEATKGLKACVAAEEKAMAALNATGTAIKKGPVDYMEAAHLVTGKVFELSASYGGNSATVQVMVSLDPRVTRPGNIVDIFSVGGELRTAKERAHGFLSGKLRFIDDIILGSDLIDNELRVGIHDETGAWLQNRENDAGNRLSAILTGKRSVGTASGIAIMHARTARRLESAIGGKLDDFATRQKIFKRTFNLLLLVVDTEYDRLTVYHRGLAKINRLPISEFVKTRGKDGGDVTDIVKLFLNGSAPTL